MVGCVEADSDYGEVFRGRIVRVYEDAANFGVSFAARVRRVEGVFWCCGNDLLVMIGLGLILGVDGVWEGVEEGEERGIGTDIAYIHMSFGHLSLTGMSAQPASYVLMPSTIARAAMYWRKTTGAWVSSETE